MFVHGSFAEDNDAAEAVRSLMQFGFDARYIRAWRHTANGRTNVQMKMASPVRRGAKVGAAVGAILGALVGAAASLIAAYPFLAALQGSLAGGVSGGILGSVVGLVYLRTGVTFAGPGAADGKIVIGVDADTRTALARDLLLRGNAEQVRLDGLS